MAGNHSHPRIRSANIGHDNGMGIDKDTLRMLRTRLASEADEDVTAHIGLYNTNKRIKLAYGPGYGMTIRSKYGFGTSVQMTVPINE
ncbi:sensor histidine kinase [Paenibacillus thalictri]|uniref:Histidine kinase/HSP90-like ATPase domain-containing protein n=1 Tax=Paenibacillus thalictri TaxID=2527873 RepID=A0A4Q9DD24_9BACL|nr:hypothetical protein [Paenibacillus thalictri]TBL68604.1 hypothetical protein EYB31_37625 [Paenibacillus thalictri]